MVKTVDSKETKKVYDYVGSLFVNKGKDGKTYLKGKIGKKGKEIAVIGFLNKITIKNGDHAGEEAEVYSLAIDDKGKNAPVSTGVKPLKGNSDVPF